MIKARLSRPDSLGSNPNCVTLGKSFNLCSRLNNSLTPKMSPS